VYHSQEQKTFSYQAEITYESAMFAGWTKMGPLRLTALSLKCSGDCLEGKGENYQVCSVQYCVQQLCTVRCTHI